MAGCECPVLAGKTALVTGGGRGIGAATALALAQAGADVAVAARTEAEVQSVAEQVRALGRRSVAVCCDLAREDECLRAVEEASRELGGVAILVNNAGTARFAPMWETTGADFGLHMNLNLAAAFHCSRAVLPSMMAARSGWIVNVASSSGKKPYPKQGLYCASKAALIMLSKCMALELRDHGIRVHAVCPGAVDTRMSDQVHPERHRQGWIQPEDVASTILHLLAMPPHIATDEISVRRFMADPL